ncbi:TPA: hypothetical protein DDW69_03460 [candidate division CPR2 bacterium]|nr:MAG: hypothetical protein A2Y26_02305 [candidate division CPR2 bacterium GWD2_39_7]HBG81872.1 hypothetical protein [candidate division CPR2 bacterium]HCL99955.1 hypothetical protein [candidate division CPR2 bacterium]
MKLNERLDMKTRILDGANMDIDLTSGDQTSWKQTKCPWNEEERTNTHKCAVKNISICKYFCGIQYLDNVMCCYPNKNTLVDNKQNK